MSGGGGETTTTNTTSQPWAGSQPYLLDLMGQARDNLANPPQYYPGATYLPPTQGQLGAWDTRLNYADQVFGGATAPKFGEATSALSKQLSGTPDYSGVQASIDAANAPLMQQLNNDIIPGLNSRATFLNNGTGGIKTLNRVLPQLGSQMQQNALSITEQERQRALNAQQQGLQNFGSMYALGMQPGELQSQFGDWGAGFQNQALQDQIGRYNYYQNLPNQMVQQYGSMIIPAAGLGHTSDATSSTNNPQQGFQNAIGIATLLAALTKKKQ